LGLLLIFLLRRSGPAAARAALAILAGCWLWVAVAFHLLRYSSIHWAGRYFAAAFAVEAVLLLLFAFGRRTAAPGGTQRWGIAVFAFALLLQPLAGLILGRPFASMELFGLTPDPTSVATLGVLLAARGRGQWVLALLPAAWGAVSGATLLATSVPGAWVTPAATGAALLFAIRGGRASGPEEKGVPGRGTP
jgi:hypothetical protein